MSKVLAQSCSETSLHCKDRPRVAKMVMCGSQDGENREVSLHL